MSALMKALRAAALAGSTGLVGACHWSHAHEFSYVHPLPGGQPTPGASCERYCKLSGEYEVERCALSKLTFELKAPAQLRCLYASKGAEQPRAVTAPLPAGLSPGALAQLQEVPLSVCKSACNPRHGVLLGCAPIPAEQNASKDEVVATCTYHESGGFFSDTPSGRAPANLGERAQDLGPTRARSAGQHLAQAARMEAMSVEAFRILAQELAALGAPRALIAQAQAAAQDEARHAQQMSALARRYGALPAPIIYSPEQTRWGLPDRAGERGGGVRGGDLRSRSDPTPSSVGGGSFCALGVGQHRPG